jgi:hypothetical protein
LRVYPREKNRIDNIRGEISRMELSRPGAGGAP